MKKLFVSYCYRKNDELLFGYSVFDTTDKIRDAVGINQLRQVLEEKYNTKVSIVSLCRLE